MSHPRVPPCRWWGCSVCATAIFMPGVHEGQTLTGGVCTQKARSGCAGELVRLPEPAVAALRARMTRAGDAEQPWLTLVMKAKATLS